MGTILEQIRDRLRELSLDGKVNNIQQLFDDARDLLVMVDDYHEALSNMFEHPDSNKFLDATDRARRLLRNTQHPHRE